MASAKMLSVSGTCLHSALLGADPGQGVQRTLHAILADYDEDVDVLVVGCGKAASSMLLSALGIIGHRCCGGAVVTKYGHATPEAREAAGNARVLLVEAGHPDMDDAGEIAAQSILHCVRQSSRGAIVLALLSGGGSALTPLPCPGLTFDNFRTVSSILVACSANIDEINCCRKHMSAFSGGRLAVEAEQAGAACLISLAVSDVIGDRADVIASGPTVPDTSTFQDAMGVVRRYGLQERMPRAVLQHFEAGCAGLVAETPKVSLSIPSHFDVVAGNRCALQSAAETAQRLGYHPIVLTSCMHGEARHAATMFASMVQECLTSDSDGRCFSIGGSRRPIALLAGGETTVNLDGIRAGSRGGRNQEFALAAALALSKVMSPSELHSSSLVLAAFGTDGTDGPTLAAGAVVNTFTIEAGKRAGLDAAAFLDAHDAYGYFTALEASAPVNDKFRDRDTPEGSLRGMPACEWGGLIRSGPTGTNVMDIVLALIQ